jgi:flagellar hook-basal body complex protein FliE
MAINFSDAVSAYRNAAMRDAVPGGPAEVKPKSEAGFEDMLREATQGAITDLKAGEQQSLLAAAGAADLTDVVTAVGKAELTLQTVVAVRDKVIQAYQEVLRMPI